MASIETRIDDLYKAPLREFVAARTALAKTLTGAEAQRVKALLKPTVVPWAVNQLYWWARPVYDRLTTSGRRLRTVQIAGLEGRPADVAKATAAHRQAVAEAVAEAVSLASRDGAHPDAEALAQTLEALSLAGDSVEVPGRLTKPLRPAGFEALAGVAVDAPAARPAAPPKRVEAAQASRPSEEDHRRARQQAEADREHAAAIREAEGALQKARAAEARARSAWEHAKAEVEAAERELAAERSRSTE